MDCIMSCVVLLLVVLIKYSQADIQVSDIQVGWINTVTNKIFIYNVIKTELTLTAAHNGSMLCCIYYTVKGDTNGFKHIRRFVKDKTLLIHQEKLSSEVEPSGTTTASYCENTDVKLISDTTCVLSPNTDGRNSNTMNEKGNKSMTTNEPGKDSNATNVPGKNSTATNVPGKNCNSTNEPGKDSYATNVPGKNSTATNLPGKNCNATNEPDQISNTKNESGINSNTKNEPGNDSNATIESGKVTNETDKNLNPPDKTDSSDHDAATNSNSNFIIIIISSISASVLVLVAIYVVYKRCRRGTNQRERPQLPLPKTPSQRSPEELDPNSPFYLNLLLRKESQLEIQAREEPQYEEIMYQ